MKKLLLLITTWLFAFASQATLLSLEFEDLDYQVGDSVAVNLVISDDDPFNFDKILAGFAVDLDFNGSVLNFDSVVFGNNLNVFFDSFQAFDNSTNGLLTLSEDSLDLGDDLLTVQNGLSRFVLATINFDIAGAGLNLFTLSNAFLTEANLNTTLDVVNVRGAQLNVAAAEVPEPSVFALFLVAGLALVVRKKSIVK